MSSSAETLVVPSLKDILFATDFSPCSEAALPLLRSLALCCASTVHVVHVVSPEPKTAVPLDLIPEMDRASQEADKAMASLLAGDAFRGMAHTVTVERGPVGEIITELAEEKHVGLIVLGTHGRRGLKKLVLGSTAEQVIRMAPRPVLTVGPESCRQAPQVRLGPILVAMDFAGGPHPALHQAAMLALANRVPLILLHAVPPNMDIPQGGLDTIPFDPLVSAELMARAVETSRLQIAELVQAEKLLDLNPEIMVESGPPADVVLRIAREAKAAMIIMGAHRSRMHSVAAHLPWAMTTAVLCEAPCPVMTVRD